MQGAKYFIIITNRNYTNEYTAFLKEFGIDFYLKKMCKGTATHKTLEILGIQSDEKVLFEGMVREERVSELKKGLLKDMDISAIGNGIAVFLPIDSIGGTFSKNYLLGEKPLEKGEEMVNQSELVLITAIADVGYAEKIMDSAREAGATGGTVVKANGTGADMAQFFGVSISKEKDMVYIVAKRDNRDAIMHAIMEKAGSATEAHGIVYALPVDSVCGIKSFEK